MSRREVNTMANEDVLAKKENAEVTRRQRAEEYFQPAVDISENENEVIMTFDMPGVGKDDVEITAEKNTLTVVGNVKTGHSGNAVYQETRLGNYRRQFALPDDVDADNISAQIENGVLEIKVRKPEKVKPKKIEVLCG